MLCLYMIDFNAKSFFFLFFYKNVWKTINTEQSFVQLKEQKQEKQTENKQMSSLVSMPRNKN